MLDTISKNVTEDRVADINNGTKDSVDVKPKFVSENLVLPDIFGARKIVPVSDVPKNGAPRTKYGIAIDVLVNRDNAENKDVDMDKFGTKANVDVSEDNKTAERDSVKEEEYGILENVDALEDTIDYFTYKFII